MAPFAEHIIVKRRQGRIYEVVVLDAAGNEVCQLPTTCVKFKQRAGFREAGEWSFAFQGYRVKVRDVDEQPTEPMEVVPR